VKKNVADIVLLLFTIVVSLMVILSIVFYKKSSVKKYNTQLFDILDIQDYAGRVDRMERLFYDKKTPRVSRTLCGIKLSQEYHKRKDMKNFVKINEEIMGYEKDAVFRNISGLNILHTKLNEENMDVDYLEKLFLKLENKKNPFWDVVLEKKAIFYLRQGKKEEAKNIFNSLLLNDSVDDNFRSRIKDYMRTL
jgi:hypothetical protein